MDALTRKVQVLEQRLQRVEDELTIRNLVVSYGPAVDLGDADAVAAVFTADATFDIGKPRAHPRADADVVFRGHEEIRNNLVLGEGHQSLLPNCAHTIGPVIVKVDGDKAEATGYSRIYHRADKGGPNDRFNLFRIGLNRWELERQPDGGWLISKRIAHVLGDEDSSEVFRPSLSR